MQMALCVCVCVCVREREREREDTTPVVMELKLHSNLVAISDGFVLQLPVPYNKRTTYSTTSSHIEEDFMNKLNPPSYASRHEILKCSL